MSLKNQMNIFYRFGGAIHHALKKHIYDMEPLHSSFDEQWSRYKDAEGWKYREGETWESLWALGHRLLAKAPEEFQSLGIEPILAENRVRSIDLSGSIQPDLIGTDKQGYVVVDFKVSEKPVLWDDVVDQLYRGAILTRELFNSDEEIRIVVFNLVKSTEDIVVLEDKVSTSDLIKYLRKKESESYEMPPLSLC